MPTTTIHHRIRGHPALPGLPATCILLAWMCLIGSSGCTTYLQTRSPASSISYEEKVGREFALAASTHFRWIDEPEVLDFVKDIGHRLTAHLVGSHYDYRFYVIRDPTMNAFAVPGGYICIFAGLLTQVDTVEGLAGVMAHEICHVEGNHFLRGQKKLDLTNVAAIAATILAAALGGGEGAVAAGTLAQATQRTAALHFSRQFEREADRKAINLLKRSGFDPHAMLSVFKRFYALARLNAADLPPYFYTHPLPAERIYELQGWIQDLQMAPATSPRLRTRFEMARVTARLRTEKPEKVFASQEARVKEHPGDARARFLLGFLHLKRGNLAQAVQYLGKAYEQDPSMPEYPLYLARAHQLSGHTEEAGRLLEEAYERDPRNPLVEVFLGDLYAQQDQWEQALFHYRYAVSLNPRSCAAHGRLAMAYARTGRRGESYLELGLADKCAGRYLRALLYFRKALDHLDPKSKLAKQAKEEIQWLEG